MPTLLVMPTKVGTHGFDTAAIHRTLTAMSIQIVMLAKSLPRAKARGPHPRL